MIERKKITLAIYNNLPYVRKSIVKKYMFRRRKFWTFQCRQVSTESKHQICLETISPKTILKVGTLNFHFWQPLINNSLSLGTPALSSFIYRNHKKTNYKFLLTFGGLVCMAGHGISDKNCTKVLIKSIFIECNVDIKRKVPNQSRILEIHA